MTMIINCPYCGGAAKAFLAAKDINRRVSKKIFHLRLCQRCGLNFLSDAPPDLGPYYTSNYHDVPKDRTALEERLPLQRYRINLLSRFCSEGKVLEVGPSIGEFCAAAQQAGFEVHAIEMDADCVSFLREKLGVTTHLSADPSAVLRQLPNRFDAICFWHSLEHLPNFWDVLRAARERLVPGGVILIAAPNPQAFQAKIMGANWPHHDLPRHLFGISLPWLTRWATENEMDMEFASTRDAGSIFCNRFSWGMNFKRLAPPSDLAQRVFWRLGLLFGRLWKPLEDREGKGACYTAILRNRP
jgi:2-polyprenyl-3-methyl-5-hydroxy-6-metoxy-1,4-benzoquinol methylase